MPSVGMNEPDGKEKEMNMNGDLEGVIESLRRLHWAAENRVSEAQALYEQAKAERDHIARMLKVAGVQQEEAPKPKPKKEKPQRVNEETRAAVLTAIHHWIEQGDSAIADVPGSFTPTNLEPFASSIHSTSIRNGINMLRDEGIVRAVGLKPGTPRRAPMVYVLGEGNEASE
jgi:hypothetical protein